MNSKRLLGLITVSLLMLLLTGCDDLSQEPEFKDKEVTLSAAGETRQCDIILRRRPWSISELYLFEPSDTKEDSGRTGSTKTVHAHEMNVQLTMGGTIRVTQDWITLDFAKDRRSVTVTAEPNTTGKYRRVTLCLMGIMVPTMLDIYQEPNH